MEQMSNLEENFPIMLRGPHGIGKSEIIYQLLQIFKQKLPQLEMIERRASQMTEGDLLGLPKINGKTTKWLPPEWFMEACLNPRILFFDELDRAVLEVRQGLFELGDSRKIAGYKLHPQSMIFAAINGGENSTQYQVSDLDPAELDRWVVFDINPSIEEWLEWGKNKINSTVLDFIIKNNNHLEHTGIFEPGKIYPSRRSWFRLSSTLNSNPSIITPGNPSTVLYNLTNSFVGMEAAISFQEYIKNYKKHITPEDIINKGNHNLTENWTIPEHVSLLVQCTNQGFWDKELTEKQLTNLAIYFNKYLSSEPAVKLVNDIAYLGKNPEVNEKNLIKFNKLINKKLIEIFNSPEYIKNNKEKENKEEDNEEESNKE